MSYFIWRISHHVAGLSNRSWNCVTDGLNARSLEKTPGSWLCVTEWCIKSFIVLSQRSWAIALHLVSHLVPAQAAPRAYAHQLRQVRAKDLPKKQRGLVMELHVRGVSLASFVSVFGKWFQAVLFQQASLFSPSFGSLHFPCFTFCCSFLLLLVRNWSLGFKFRVGLMICWSASHW